MGNRYCVPDFVDAWMMGWYIPVSCLSDSVLPRRLHEKNNRALSVPDPGPRRPDPAARLHGGWRDRGREEAGQLRRLRRLALDPGNSDLPRRPLARLRPCLLYTSDAA